jgi:hypothetical protein
MKEYPVFFLLVLLLSLNSCKNDPDASKKSDEAGQTEDSFTEPSRLPLFDPCIFMSVNEAAKIFGIDPTIIEIRENQFSGDFARSCNFRWTDPMDGGIYSVLLIMQSNPLPEELDDYSGAYINAKLESGDRSADSDLVVNYVKLDGVEGETAYQPENFRLYWKANNNYTMSAYLSPSFQYDKVKDHLTDIFLTVSKNAKKKLK